MAGLLTVNQMASEVADNTARSTTGQTRSGTTISALAIRYLNRAQLRIAREEDLLFCEATAATTASTKTYAFPSNIRTLIDMRLEDGLESVKLIMATPRSFDSIVPKPDESTTGRPDWYIPFKTTNTFELFRIPDAAYTMRMRYSYWATALAASDTQTTNYSNMDDVLIQYATAYLYYFLQEYGDAKEWFKLADESFSGAIKAERRAFPDWAPISTGFRSGGAQTIGEFYNDPMIFQDPSIRTVQ